jgi:hypothetical protein
MGVRFKNIMVLIKSNLIKFLIDEKIIIHVNFIIKLLT